MRRAIPLIFLSFFGWCNAEAQTTYLQLGQEDYQLFDRLETLDGKLSDRLFTTLKPLSRKNAVTFLEEQKQGGIGLSSIDRYNTEHAISVSGEWAENEDGAIDSRVSWFRTFYRKQPDFIHVKAPDFFLVVNPVISAQGMYEQGDHVTEKNLFSSSRGVELRGCIAHRIGFYTYFADNQEQMPSYMRSWISTNQAVPGGDYYMDPSAKTVDYISSAGYIDFAVVQDHVNLTFGHGKQFLGDGIRSLFLSDFSAGSTFLRLNTRVGKINYQNIFLELMPHYSRGADQNLPRKYAAIHHLSANVTSWLNIGLFESTIFGKTDQLKADYMIPVIFLHSIEHPNGVNDNSNLGINFKALALKRLQFYGQLFLDRLDIQEAFRNKGWWGNQYGLQLGGKYYDAFTVSNLDLQAEVNLVRPFTYATANGISDYTHYNQPLAHPLGANFAEFIAIARYQPVKRLYLTLKGQMYKQGVDTTSVVNYGSNIFQNVNTRSIVDPADPEYGYKIGAGQKITCTAASFNASYELRENLFIDLGLIYRRYVYDQKMQPDQTSSMFYGGLRLNIIRRDYTAF